MVVGADGLHSTVVRQVHPEQYDEKPPLLAAYYTYWSGLPMLGRFESYVRPYRALAAWPTNDGATLVIAGWPYAEFEANKSDIERHYHEVIDLVPSFADRIGGARREERFVAMAVPSYFRKPYGPGWALVGDAGHDQDPLTGQGISDAFIDAETLAEALDVGLSGARPLDLALADYQSRRDRRAKPMYDFTCELAKLEPPPPLMQQLFAALHEDQAATIQFFGAITGSLPLPEFMSQQNIGRIIARGSRRGMNRVSFSSR